MARFPVQYTGNFGMDGQEISINMEMYESQAGCTGIYMRPRTRVLVVY